MAIAGPVPTRLQEESLGDRLQRILGNATVLAERCQDACAKIEGPRVCDADTGYADCLPSPALVSVAELIESRLQSASASMDRLLKIT